MKQLVQLQESLGDAIEDQSVNVLVIFREESEGQDGLEKVTKLIKGEYTLALDMNAQQTKLYSPGKLIHDSYIIDNNGVILSILVGTRYNRAQAHEFEEALHDIEANRK
jgi:hypothetical protein